uniref:non-specific serine/threonine protein kinase n=2 Tax=Manihot esculenta TaxID=3983 RepID=A0A2C9U7Y4_MANES
MSKDTALAKFLLIIPFLILFNPTAAAESLYTYCSNDTSNYTLNTPFEENLKLLLQALPSNTSLSGFYNTSIGETPNDKIYGQALCRGDVNAAVCESCIVKASQEILKNCKSKDAIIWRDLCQVRYSFQSFFSMQVYTGKYPDWDAQEKSISNPDQFNQILKYLLSNLSTEAAFNPSRRMFATGEVKFSAKQTIYGLVQCTRDISTGDCKICLDSASGDLDACCFGKQGGIILSRNCDMRFEMYTFYNASSSNLLPNPTSQVQELTTTQKGELVSCEELPFMDLDTIITATDNFSDSNKLGQGGFGSVYKGILPDGKEIAAKRLSRKTWQGLEEFKNEIILISKLQHKNLVRLLGCGIKGDEKLLIYEFMPNRSLDMFIFNSEGQAQLDWKTRYNIICGIGRGLVYLHEDSRLKIIHRDLKPSNVLLDHEMVVKISDFGMARILSETQNAADTKRVIGTYGYMAPEYAMAGQFSVKSDVFSFGVIVLEIISGKRSSGFYFTEHAETLLAYAWHLWNEGKELEFVDPLLMETCSTEQVVKCIHVGLLCVQEDPSDRPTMSSVVVLLGDETIALPQPKQPAFSVGRIVPIDKSSTADPSLNLITISVLHPR